MKKVFRCIPQSAFPKYRLERFLFAVPSEGQARYRTETESQTMLVGSAVGREIVRSFETGSPVSEVCLYGKMGTGKSALARAVFSSFRMPEGTQVHGMKNFERVSCSFPKCLHLDYAHFWSPFYGKVRYVPKPEEDEVRITEWSELAPSFEPDRIDIEIGVFGTAEDACLNPLWRSARIVRVPNRRSLEDRGLNPRWIAIAGSGSGIDAVERLKARKDIAYLAADLNISTCSGTGNGC